MNPWVGVEWRHGRCAVVMHRNGQQYVLATYGTRKEAEAHAVQSAEHIIEQLALAEQNQSAAVTP